MYTVGQQKSDPAYKLMPTIFTFHFLQYSVPFIVAQLLKTKWLIADILHVVILTMAYIIILSEAESRVLFGQAYRLTV